mgnify:CR=1 FL=1
MSTRGFIFKVAGVGICFLSRGANAPIDTSPIINSTVVERLGTNSDVDGVGICFLNRGANALIDMPTVVARCPFW